jgi:hypothetical protein
MSPTLDIRSRYFRGATGGAPGVEIDKLETDGDTPNGQIDSIKYEGGNQYLFFKITQVNEDGVKDHAWTAPVWFVPGTATSPPVAPTPPVTAQGCPAGDHFVASKKRSIYHCSSCRDAQSISESNLVENGEAVRGRTLHEGCPRKKGNGKEVTGGSHQRAFD